MKASKRNNEDFDFNQDVSFDFDDSIVVPDGERLKKKNVEMEK